ncbi:unnamed protein product [Agarophyton chilense]|eukprot:gb/GEZJ01005721.1/.p1 GENE.gb/GEZJ01005721.1/~~gb/GEZJ01005721.1/.p1  ORF type:complete len:483 (-),score=57.95 gb/GEZJ01005721.1/:2334-3782(-)
MRLSNWRWFGPIPAAFVLQAVFGLQFANGVFASFLDDPVLTQALGLAALFVSLGITAFGVLLYYASDHSKYHAVPRVVAVFGSFAVAAQLFVSYGLINHSRFIVYVASILQGTGAGCIYVVSIVVVQDWVPESPALVTGLSLLFGGAGSLFGIYAFQALVHTMGGAIPAMAVASLAAGLVSVTASMFIERPPDRWCPVAEIFDPDTTMTLKDAHDARRVKPVDEQSACYSSIVDFGDDDLLHRKQKKCEAVNRLSCYDIMIDPAFALVFVSVFVAAGPGYGFVLSYPLMLHSLFNLSLIDANQMLCYATFFGVVGRLALGVAIDMLSSSSFSSSNGEQAPNIRGSKVTNIFILLLQTGGLALMPVAIRTKCAWLFHVAVFAVFVAFNGGAVVAACLARDVFAPENSTLAFALLGVAVGVARALFSIVLAACDGNSGVGAYDWYIGWSIVVSVVGVAGSYLIEPAKCVNFDGANNRVFADMQV